MRRPHSSGIDTMLSAFPSHRAPRPSARTRHALALGIALALVGGATAATAPQRFTPVLGEGAALYPQSPASSDAPPRAIDATQRDIDNLVVELDANHLPADGQTATTVRVRLLGADGQPLRGERFATIEHSGGRVLLDGASTDEGGPGRRLPSVVRRCSAFMRPCHAILRSLRPRVLSRQATCLVTGTALPPQPWASRP